MTRISKLEAITFDVGGTLIKPWPSVGHVYAEIAARHGIKKASPEMLNRKFGAAWQAMKSFNHGREEWAALVDQTFAGLGDEPPSQTFFPELYDRFSEPDAWHVFEDVVPTLEALAASGMRLGIISNWDERLLPLLERLRLHTYFDAIVVSCDVGFAKPSPVIFEHAAKKLGAAPELILHVGDSSQHDVAGATAAGFQSRLIDRKEDPQPPLRIKSLHELEVEVY
ncbi:MAG: REG-2-like, superfamily [Pedosphaera sp.]|nr:REG-2-like, superfamily [Pedosphaera sp.]